MSYQLQTPKITYGSQPWKFIFYGLLLISLPLAVGWVSYEYGRGTLMSEVLPEGKTEPSEAGTTLQLENQALHMRIAALQRSLRIDQVTATRMQVQMKALQDENLRLTENLAFYRNIVSPEDGKEGLRIQNFKLQPDGTSGNYHYEIVLIQSLKNDQYVKGTTRFYIDGKEGEKSAKYDLDKLSTESLKGHEFRFKYFQNLKGTLALPEGFVPEQVTVEAIPSGKRQQKVEMSFDWPRAG